MQLIDEEFKKDMELFFSTRFRDYWFDLNWDRKYKRGNWVDVENHVLWDLKAEDLEVCN